SNTYYYTGILAVSDEELVTKLKDSGVDYVSPIAQQATILDYILTLILPLAISLLLLFLVLRVISKRMGSGGVMSFGKNTSKIYAEKSTGKTFADVAGQDEAKESLVEIIDFLNNPKKYTDIGAKLPKGALLVGPPGTGKTLLAKAVAGEAGVPFSSLSGSEFVEMFVGVGASRVRDLFRQAVDNAPCIVFIDEIDAIGKSRDNGLGSNDEREQTLNQLLSEMDGFDSSKGVVILAATNRPEVLDKALLRPGRFDRRIIVDLPDQEGRVAILKVHSKDVKMESDVDLEVIARATAGASGADMENIINEAALHAVRAGKSKVSQTELEEAVEIILAGEEKKNRVMSDDEKHIVAYHETGHALVTALLSHTEPVHKITIIPRTSGTLGYVMQVAQKQKVLFSKEDLLNEIKVLSAGRAAEQLQFGFVTTGASNDIERATALARSMITKYGMLDGFGFTAWERQQSLYLPGDSSVDCSDATELRIDNEIINITGAAYREAAELLSAHKDTLDKLAGTLFEKETLTGDEFMAFMREYEPETAALIDARTKAEKEKAEAAKAEHERRKAGSAPDAAPEDNTDANIHTDAESGN
ncbi:MAG: ATP-dependent zinc metalloprotease FtsH, partial [Clostridia bacterium]|nr:ATP-dependent zinc metalloprotease FtsH [Clostridia bacterium]